MFSTGQKPEMCPNGCRMLFFSKAATTRHQNLFHLGVARASKRTRPQADEAAHVCNFVQANGEACAHKAASAYYLRKHKNEKGHVNKRNKK